MEQKNKFIQGDLALWGFLALLAIFSFFPVFSASSNLSYVVGNGTPWQHLFKHMFILVMGFVIMIGIHRIPFHYFKGISILMLPIVILLLIYTVSQGTTIGGANASRWIRIPFVGIGFQTSTLAFLVLMMYVAHYLDKTFGQQLTFSQTLLPLWLPVGIVVALILPANLSTAVIVFAMVFVLCFFGNYPIKHLLVILAIGLVAFIMFVLASFHHIAIGNPVFYTDVLMLLSIIFVSLHYAYSCKTYIIKRSMVSTTTKAIKAINHLRVHLWHIGLHRFMDISR